MGVRFYAALWRALLEADLGPLGAIHEDAPDAPSLAAAVAALVSVRFEDESVPTALAELRDAICRKDLSPVDRAWLGDRAARATVRRDPSKRGRAIA